MEINKETYQLFQNYLDGKLSVFEEESFSQRLLTDESFQQAFQEFELERSLLIYNELAESKEMLEGFSYEPPKPSFNKLYYWLIGLGVLTISSLLFMPSDHEVDKVSIETVTEKKVEVLHKKNTEKEENDKAPNVANAKPSVLLEDKNTQDVPTIRTNKDSIVETPIDSVKAETPILVAKRTEKEISNISDSPKIKIKTETAEKNSDCETKKWEVKMKIDPSCSNQENGQVEVLTKQNVTVFFDQEERKKDLVFSNLAEGEYELLCVDQQGCEYEQEIVIPSKICVAKDLIIDANTNTFWEVPLDAMLIIRNSTGRIVLKTQVSQEDEYTGIDQYGVPLKSGVYFFELQAKENYRGTITIP